MALNNRRTRVTRVAVFVALVVIVIVMNFPIYWMTVSSFKGQGELFLREPTFLPQDTLLENYPNVFRRIPFAAYLRNSIIVSLVTTLAAVSIGIVSGYSYARFRFKGKQSALFVILLTQMFPALLLVIPMYLILNSFGLINTHLGLIVAYSTFTLPFCVWMMRGFFQTIPVELEECAILDGCNRLQVLSRITLPLAAPGAAATACFAFVVAWNEFLFALNLTTSEVARTLPVGLSLLVGRYFNDWGVLMAAAVMTTLPTLLIFLFLQKYLITGLTAGAVKG